MKYALIHVQPILHKYKFPLITKKHVRKVTGSLQRCKQLNSIRKGTINRNGFSSFFLLLYQGFDLITTCISNAIDKAFGCVTIGGVRLPIGLPLFI